jgi:hypothetical protein
MYVSETRDSALCQVSPNPVFSLGYLSYIGISGNDTDTNDIHFFLAHAVVRIGKPFFYSVRYAVSHDG